MLQKRKNIINLHLKYFSVHHSAEPQSDWAVPSLTNLPIGNQSGCDFACFHPSHAAIKTCCPDSQKESASVNSILVFFYFACFIFFNIMIFYNETAL